MHPNIPGSNESGLTVMLHRTWVMIIALWFPELVAVWALHQFLDAREAHQLFKTALQEGDIELRVKHGSEPYLVTRDVQVDAGEKKLVVHYSAGWHEYMNSCSSKMFSSIFFHKQISRPSSDPAPELHLWTMKHAFFMWMGGFMLFVNKEPHGFQEYAPLTPHELLKFIKEDSVRVAMISEKQIEDKSKHDWLSKAITFLQLAWFILQLAARTVERLPTTQFEVVTLAISLLSCCTYVIWWNKPKDVHCAVAVYWKGSNPPGRTTYSHSKSIDEMTEASSDGKGISSLDLRLLKLVRPILDLLGSGTVSKAAVREHRVPTLGGYFSEVNFKEDGQLTWDWERNVGRLLGLAFPVGVIFVAVHVIAWDFFFPSDIEKRLWHAATLGMLCSFVLGTLLILRCAWLSCRVGGKVTPECVQVLQTLAPTIIAYVVLRLIMMVLMLISLRSVDPGVHDTVCWTTVIPHL